MYRSLGAWLLTGFDSTGWLVVLDLTALRDSLLVYIGPSPREWEKEEKK